jgi:hypothetical protein
VAITAQQIKAYLTRKHSPLAAYANDFIAVGAKYHIDPRFLVAVSGAETSFGTAGSKLANPFGYMSARRFSGPREVLERLARDLTRTGPQGLYKGKSTIAQIGATWAPPGASNDAGGNSGWPRAVGQFYREQGGNPNAPVKGGGVSVGPIAGGAQMPAPGVQSGSPAGGSSFDSPRIMALLKQQHEGIMSGAGYNQDLGAQARALVVRGLPTNNPASLSAVAGPRSAAVAAPGGNGQYSASASDVGLGYGGVDSRLVTKGGAGGDWGGSMQVALSALKAVENDGYRPNSNGHWVSQKRSKKLTASGNPSDHWAGSTKSYAVDLGVPNGAEGDKYLSDLVRYFGLGSYKGGSWLNVNKGGYRLQIGWKVPGHFDHIHVGVRKL